MLSSDIDVEKAMDAIPLSWAQAALVHSISLYIYISITLYSFIRIDTFA